MSLRLLPGIVWVLDDTTGELVQRWYDGLGPKAQSFLKVARNIGEVRSFVQEFMALGFNQTMLDAGLDADPSLRGRLLLILVAQISHGGTTVKWEEVERSIEAIEPETRGLESHRMLVARGLLPQGWRQGLAGLRAAPWLLTDRITGGLVLSTEELGEFCAQLLDALLLAEKEGLAAGGPAIQSFYRNDSYGEQVRLAGFSRLSLDKLMARITSMLARSALRRCYLEIPDLARVRGLEQQLAQKITQFFAKRLGAEQVIKFIIGPQGLGGWTTTDLLHHGERVLIKEIDRLQRKEGAEPSEPGLPTCFCRRILRKILEWMGFRKRIKFVGPGAMQLEYLRSVFQRLRERLEGWMGLAQHEYPTYPDVPGDLMKNWIRSLDQDCHYALRHHSEYHLDMENLLGKLARRMEPEVATHFNEVIVRWGLKDYDPLVREVARALEQGNLLWFSARRRVDLDVQAKGLVTSLRVGGALNHGAQMIPCATLRIWPGRPPLLVAASDPVPLDQLRLEIIEER